MVYDILKRRFMYENIDNMDEAWTFEAIPYMRQQVNYQEKVSCLRILRWLSAKTDKNVKFLDLFNPPKEAIVPHLATVLHANVKTTRRNMNAINALAASVKEMTSKRGVISSKRISYPYTPLKIKVAKRRRKDISKASLSIEKRKIAMPLSLSCTVVQCARAIEEKHELKKLAKILPTYLDMSGFLDQNIRTDWSTTEAYRDKMGNPFDVQYVEGISQNCGPFAAAYVEYLSDGLQVQNDDLDAGLLHKIYAAILWKYEEAKLHKPYSNDIKDPRRPNLNSVSPDEEQLVHID
ncbi:hypothetical protein CQW23_01132 [Capsicum baccatum]|uniref:Ubiquitin-like protease family profile domain-containing protein n=1 Tax=Capsicum baccatum TaxID=33114 RepID=A0A2G2XMU4_CAPBA|nr:hypothetical protein CQW23_01132 [Capsicum baccatum]